MKQTHNPVTIRRAGFDNWYKQIQKNVDMDRTLANVDADNVEVFWKSVWDGLVTGVHLKHNGADFADDIIKGFSGPGNLGKKLSEKHRQKAVENSNKMGLPVSTYLRFLIVKQLGEVS